MDNGDGISLDIASGSGTFKATQQQSVGWSISEPVMAGMSLSVNTPST
jgi:hypothetical protein